MPTHHRLLVMRHSKSSWSTPSPDHRRPLNKRGQRDGLAAGEWLAKNIGTIDHVLCSTATRTRLSWERAKAGGATSRGISFHDEMYESEVASFWPLLTQLPESIGTALFLGHWPGVEDLSRQLAERDDHPGWESMDVKFPTSAIAVLEIPVAWKELAPGAARLSDYTIPRG